VVALTILEREQILREFEDCLMGSQTYAVFCFKSTSGVSSGA
jgi:hypothetical protein